MTKPQRDGHLIKLPKRSTGDWDFTLYDAADSTVALAGDDQARCKIWSTHDATPALDLTNTATANGSRVYVSATSPAVVRLRIGQDDTASLEAGDYQFEVAIVDNSETAPADAYEVFCTGILRLMPSATGSRGLV